MKKIVAGILAVTLVLSFCACGKKTSENAGAEGTTTTPTTKLTVSDVNNVEKPTDSSKTLNYKITTQVMNDTSHKNSTTTAKYPQLISDEKDYSVVNKMIEGSVRNCFGNFPEDYEDMTFTMNYRVTMSTDKLVSIVFEGDYNMVTAAHPNSVFFTFNIDLEQASKIKLKDIYTIDGRFIDLFRKQWPEQTDPGLADYLNTFSNDEIMRMFADTDNEASSVYSYFTDGKLGISFSVPHALGDHIEIEINNNDLSGRKSDATEATKISTSRAEELVSEIIKVNPNGNAKILYDHTQKINGKEYYVIHGFESMEDHSATFGWYYVDVNTGDVYDSGPAMDEFIPMKKAS